MQKLRGKGQIFEKKIWEAAAHWGGGEGDSGMGEGGAGGKGDDNPFMALCNSGVLNECTAWMDFEVMAASLVANDHLQHHINSFMKQLSMCPTTVSPNLPTSLIFWILLHQLIISHHLHPPVILVPSQSCIVPSALNPVWTCPQDLLISISSAYYLLFSYVLASTYCSPSYFSLNLAQHLFHVTMPSLLKPCITSRVQNHINFTVEVLVQDKHQFLVSFGHMFPLVISVDKTRPLIHETPSLLLHSLSAGSTTYPSINNLAILYTENGDFNALSHHHPHSHNLQPLILWGCFVQFSSSVFPHSAVLQPQKCDRQHCSCPHCTTYWFPFSTIFIQFLSSAFPCLPVSPQFHWFSPTLYLIHPSSVPAASDLIHMLHHHISCPSLVPACGFYTIPHFSKPTHPCFTSFPISTFTLVELENLMCHIHTPSAINNAVDNLLTIHLMVVSFNVAYHYLVTLFLMFHHHHLHSHCLSLPSCSCSIPPCFSGTSCSKLWPSSSFSPVFLPCYV